MKGGWRAVLEKLHSPGFPSLDVGGSGGVNPRTARRLLKDGYVFTWASGEFDPWGPYVHISAKRNDPGDGRWEGPVRTQCSCDAGVLAMKCEACGGAADFV